MIELSNVSMQYPMAHSSVTVLEQLSLCVSQQERVAIVGPSGSGKSTLLLILTGLEQATSGSVTIQDQKLDALTPDERAELRRKHIGIIFQSFHLIPTLNARDNVALPLNIGGGSNTRQRALDMLNTVGLGNRSEHYPSQLSGGEQQRVAIARALINEPALLVADEPTGNLDKATGESIMQLLFDLNQSSETTLVLVTHNLDLAARCDRTLRLQDGYLHDTGTGVQQQQSGLSPGQS